MMAPTLAPAGPPAPAAAAPPVQAGIGSGFSATRPVIVRDDLFGRQAELDHLLGWMLDQHGSALVYGPRGYGKTSLALVVAEIADVRGHVVAYASCSRKVDFTSLLKFYLREIEGLPEAVLAEETLGVHQVADLLAAVTDQSLLFIIDEYDRLERDDTRENIIELIKDAADLNAPVQFLIVGVASNAAEILGYHPSVNRCLTCVPLARLGDAAIEELFRRKAAIDGIDVPPATVATIVRLSAGSAYHAQLIGQQLVARAWRTGESRLSPACLDDVLREIIVEGMRIDQALDAMSREFAGNAAGREALLRLAQAALEDPDDILRPAIFADEGIARYGQALRAAGIIDAAPGRDGFRFINAFAPQMLLAMDHVSLR